MTELDRLKKELCYSLIPVSIEMGDVHDDLNLRIDAVIAHLEAQLSESEARSERRRVLMEAADRGRVELKDRLAILEAALAESHAREKALREGARQHGTNWIRGSLGASGNCSFLE